ncbi:MAG: hypothetical protein DRO01_07740 [Thermoproteota archaeon]|nr:MAG: hypothetical protein DRO01_07740 [Candidatus Korarchaeota archaeon]HDH99846.1 hypothetical protein [Bacillota bacterium]
MKAEYSPELEAELRNMAHAHIRFRPRASRIFRTIVRDNIGEGAVFWPTEQVLSALLRIARRDGLYLRDFYGLL